jgi:hypothetical protein
MDAENQIVLQSMLDLPWNFKLDLTSRFVDRLPQTQYNPRNPSYVNLDARLAWRSKKFELSVSGQDLLKDTHVEIGNKQIKRGVYGRITWRM